MSLALWPGLLLSLVAIGIAANCIYVLSWQAPVAAAPLTAALTRHVERGELARAYALCRALERCWAADCAQECLHASEERADLRAARAVVDELNAGYRQRAQAGLLPLQALGRIAFPLALGTAIAVMSGAFVAADVARVERALSTALQCLTVGVMTAVFCRASAAAVSRQGEARLREIAAVCRGVQAALAAGARSPSSLM